MNPQFLNVAQEYPDLDAIKRASIGGDAITFEPAAPVDIQLPVTQPVDNEPHVHRALARCRSAYPFLAIMQLPQQVQSMKIGNAAAVNFEIPSGALLALFTGTENFWISSNGAAFIPTGTGEAGDSQSILVPAGNLGYWWYVGGLRALSVYGSSANTLVSAQYYLQL
jgi:hypothetical protein